MDKKLHQVTFKYHPHILELSILQPPKMLSLSKQYQWMSVSYHDKVNFNCSRGSCSVRQCNKVVTCQIVWSGKSRPEESCPGKSGSIIFKWLGLYHFHGGMQRCYININKLLSTEVKILLFVWKKIAKPLSIRFSTQFLLVLFILVLISRVYFLNWDAYGSG